MMRTDEVLGSQRIQRKLLEAPIRARIYERVVRVPGIHLRRLVRDLELAMGTVEHHLHLLERHALIFHYKGARRKTYYARENVDPGDVPYLHALRNRIWRKVLLDVLNEPDIGFGDLAARMHCSASTSAYHLRRLLSMGLLQRTAVGRNAYYRLAEPERVRALIEAYRSTYRGLVGDRQHVGKQEEPTPQTIFEYLLRRIPDDQVLPAPPLFGPRVLRDGDELTITR
jgi:DNA-binding transcriptional ArsR family regulator